MQILLLGLTSSVYQTNTCGEIEINLSLYISGKHEACHNYQFTLRVTFFNLSYIKNAVQNCTIMPCHPKCCPSH